MRKALTILAALSALAACSSEPAETAEAGGGKTTATDAPTAETGGLLDSTESVCDEFAQFIKDGRPDDQRSDVISSIGEVIDNAHERVQDGFSTLTNTVNGPQGAQSIADDTFAQACFDAGWDG